MRGRVSITLVPMAVLLWLAALLTAAEGPAPARDDPAATVEAAVDVVAEVAPTEMLSYGIGLQVGHDFRRLERPLDREALLAGIRDAMARAEPRFTPAEMRAALRRLEEDRPTAGR